MIDTQKNGGSTMGVTWQVGPNRWPVARDQSRHRPIHPPKPQAKHCDPSKCKCACGNKPGVDKMTQIDTNWNKIPQPNQVHLVDPDNWFLRRPVGQQLLMLALSGWALVFGTFYAISVALDYF